MVNNKAIRQGLYERLNRAPLTAALGQDGPYLPGGSASIHHSVAPQESRYPLLVFFKTSAISVGVFGTDNEAYRDHIWTVKGVARNTRSGEAEDIDKAAHDLLTAPNGVTITGTDDGFPGEDEVPDPHPMLITRISDVEYTEVVGDTQYRHCGGNYRLVIQDA